MFQVCPPSGLHSKVFLFQVSGGLHQNADGSFEAGGSANVILYVGLGMISVGLIITFVGLGEKGFKTLELKLIGPSLVGCGVFFSLLRVLFCTVPSCARSCIKRWRKTEDGQKLLTGEQVGSPNILYLLLCQVLPVHPSRGSNGLSAHPSSVRPSAPRRPSVGEVHQGRGLHQVHHQVHHQPVTEEEEEQEGGRPRIKPVRQKGRRPIGNGRVVGVEPGEKQEVDNDSTASSSNVSLADGVLKTPHLEDISTNHRPGEIVLNATRLSVEPT